MQLQLARIAVVVLLAAACSDDDTAEPSTTSGTPSTTVAPTTSTARPPAGGLAIEDADLRIWLIEPTAVDHVVELLDTAPGVVDHRFVEDIRFSVVATTDRKFDPSILDRVVQHADVDAAWMLVDCPPSDTFGSLAVMPTAGLDRLELSEALTQLRRRSDQKWTGDGVVEIGVLEQQETDLVLRDRHVFAAPLGGSNGDLTLSEGCGAQIRVQAGLTTAFVVAAEWGFTVEAMDRSATSVRDLVGSMTVVQKVLPGFTIPDLAGETIGPNGLPSVSIGDTLEELSERGFAVTSADCEVEYVWAEPFGPIGLDLVNDVVANLYLYDGRDNGYDNPATTNGVGIGSTRAEVLATYGDTAEERVVEHVWTEDLVDLDDQIVVRVSGQEGPPVLIFSMEDDVVWGIRVGNEASFKFRCA